jgi:hypothetical protein
MADTVRELVIKVSVENDTKKGFSDVEKGQERAQVKTTALGSALGGLAVELGKVALQAVKAGAAMLNDLVFGTAEAADEIAKTSDRLSVATDQLQRMRGAAQLTGASTGDLTNGIRVLQKNLGEGLAKGGGPAVEALAALGLEIFEGDAALQEGDIEGTLGLIGDAANKIEDPVQRNAALMKLLGGAGSQLGPLLAQGTAGIKGLGDQISATGSVIEDDALGQFEALQDASLLMDLQIQGIKSTIATAAVPAFTDISNQVREWTSENQGIISQDLPALLTSVASAAVTLVTGTLELVSVWREFGRDVGRAVDLLADDLAPALDLVGQGVDVVGNAAGFAATKVLDLVDSFLEAIGAGEELRNLFKEIRGDIAGGDSQGQRGAPKFLGGGDALVNPADVEAARASGDTTKLKKIAADPKFSEADRAIVASEAAKIDSVTAAKAQAEADKAAAKRSAGIEASRARARATQAATRRATGRAKFGGGGGGGRPAEPSVEDLIAQAAPAGAGGGAALRSAASALSGTLLVTQITNNNLTNTVQVGGIEVSAQLPDVGPETADALGAVIEDKLTAQTRQAVDWLTARRNVSF